MYRFTHATRRAALGIALLALGASVFAGCASEAGGDEDANGNGNGATTATATATAASGGGGGAEVGEEMEIHVVFTDNAFDPSEVTIPAGTRVKFEYANEGTAIHNMMIQSQETEGQLFQSPTIVNPGDEGEFEGTFTTPGTVSFICVYHQPDMTGTLTVE